MLLLLQGYADKGIAWGIDIRKPTDVMMFYMEGTRLTKEELGQKFVTGIDGENTMFYEYDEDGVSQRTFRDMLGGTVRPGTNTTEHQITYNMETGELLRVRLSWKNWGFPYEYGVVAPE